MRITVGSRKKCLCVYVRSLKLLLRAQKPSIRPFTFSLFELLLYASHYYPRLFFIEYNFTISSQTNGRRDWHSYITGTQALQGLYTLYTNDHVSPSPITTYSDVAAILWPLSDNNSVTAYQHSISHFTQWCTENCLQLNSDKTEELVFGTSDTPHTGQNPSFINGKNRSTALNISESL